jgi:hypothetical protein
MNKIGSTHLTRTMTKLTKVDELTAPPIVGRYYWVPCIDFNLIDIYFPIRGSLHHDVELNGCHKLHWHYDWRFMPVRLIKLMGMNPYDERDWEEAPIRILIKTPELNTEPVYKRLRCKRVDNEVPYPEAVYYKNALGYWTNQRNRVGFRNKLYRRYKSESLNCNKCPHRGYDLTSVPADKRGKKECPLHGLKFNAAGKVCR